MPTIDFVKKKNIYFIYFVYIIFIFFTSLIFSFFFSKKFIVADSDGDLIIKNITFGFGNLIDNLYNYNSYFEIIEGTKYFLTKMPALPILYWSILKISNNYIFFICVKNIIIFTIYFFLTYYLSKNFKKKKTFYLLLLVPIIIPYNFNVSLNYVYEDNLISIFLPLLFLSLININNNKIFIISLITFILFFTKTTMFLIVTIIPLIILLIEKKINFYFRVIPIIFSFLAIITWGTFGLSKTGRFPFASSMLTTNSQGFSFVLNKEFKNYYPNKSVDIIPSTTEKTKFKSEWEAYDYYANKNKDYIKENYNFYIKDILIKLKFIFFGIHKDGITSNDLDEKNMQIRYSSIVSKLLLNVAIIFSSFKLIKNINNINANKIEIYFLFIVILNLTPHIFAWATSKHLVGIFNVSSIYLLIVFTEKKIVNLK
jgi:hypothetical protein